MKDTIVRKKMYKAGKNWVVASVAVAAMVAGSAKVSADQTTNDTTSDSAIVTSTETPETSDKDTTYTLKNDDSDKGLTQEAKATTTTKDADTVAETETPVADVAQTDTTTNKESEAVTEDKADAKAPVADDNVSDETAKDVSKEQAPKETDGVKELDNLAKLNDTAKKIAKDANLDPSKLTDEQIDSLNKVVVDKANGTKMTYKNFEDISKALINQDNRYAIPYFNASQIKNMPAAHTRDAETGEVTDLDIWDSWPVQDPKTGYVSDWNGYQLVIAMMGRPGYEDNHIYLLYNKYGDNDFSHWKNAGSIFGYNESYDIQEWSGSAIVNNDNSIQLFYTKNDNSGDKHNDQRVATATLYLDHTDNDVSIARVENDRVIFAGDGYHYQTYDQWKQHNTFDDDFTLRDSHVVETDNGDRYLVFEANTGTQDYQGEHQIYKWSNYGGDAAYNTNSLFDILSHDDYKNKAKWANAAIGILKLTNDQKNPQVEEVFNPLMTAPMVSDEIERPNVVKLGDKYYLFAASRLTRGVNNKLINTANTTVGDNVIMVGYVSDNLMSGYQPLNGSGVVLTASVPANWRTATYSYYAVPVAGYTDRVLVTAYMTNRGGVAGEGKNSTWAPSFLVQINPDGTTQVLSNITNQGDWIWDGSSENPAMLGDFEMAALPGDKERTINWDLIGYGAKKHDPVYIGEPDRPTTPTDPETPSTPTDPDRPTDPEEPFVPEEFIVTDDPTPNTPEVSRSSMLPQAGEKQSPVAMILAGMSAIMMSLGLAKTKKRK